MSVPPHPEPPPELALRELPSETCTPDILWRNTSARFVNEPLFFGRQQRYRFDAPAGGFGVCYLAFDFAGAFIETFGRSLDWWANFVTCEELRQRAMRQVRCVRALRVVNLSGAAAVRLGVDARLAGGENYMLCRRWSAALHAHPDTIDGLLYRSRHDNDCFCLALFERAREAVEVEQTRTLSDPVHERNLVSTLDRYDFGLLEF